MRLISSSVLPENIEPQTTSILPGRWASHVKFSVIWVQMYKYVLKIAKIQPSFFEDSREFITFVSNMGILYIVPTPVGNMEDITFRAVRVLREAVFVSHHKFNEHGTSAAVVERLRGGQTVALVSDAGTPAISDPGFYLVREAVKAGIEVQCLPGATAFVPALVSSGLPCDRFCFEGFLPAKKGRQTRPDALSSERRTMIFYESPHRLVKTLVQFADVFGPDRRVSVCREISKVHEESVRGTLAEVIDRFMAAEPRGEIVIVLAGAGDRDRENTENVNAGEEGCTTSTAPSARELIFGTSINDDGHRRDRKSKRH